MSRRERVNFHALRHTFCMLLANAGTPPHTLMKLARHSKIQSTMKYYTHSVLETQAGWVGHLCDSVCDLNAHRHNNTQQREYEHVQEKPPRRPSKHFSGVFICW
ncbi:MAG: tyrosine-type recombinase/integrase [Planctomycetota bacterium]